MSAVNSDSMRAGASGVSAAGYVIENSCRFNPTDTAFLSKTFGSAGDRRTWTFSIWTKRGRVDSESEFICVGTDNNNLFQSQFSTNGSIYIQDFTGSSNQLIESTMLLRDPSAWYHIVFVWDTTDGTAGDRFKLYINGVRVTDFTAEVNASLNYEGYINKAAEFTIGEKLTNSTRYYDGYMAQITFQDGVAAPITDLGEFDTNGNWVPIDVSSLTFGTNGFHLDFAVAPGTGNGAGTDVSGNGNHFTDSGLAANDQMTDSPTDDASSDVGNYATIGLMTGSAITVKNGNLEFDNTVTGKRNKLFIPFNVQTFETDGCYWEMTLDAVVSYGGYVGLINYSGDSVATFLDGTTYYADAADQWTYRTHTGEKNIEGIVSAYGSGAVATDVLGFAYKGGKCWVSLNNTWANSGDPAADTNEMVSGLNTEGVLYPGFTDGGNNDKISGTWNFGQSAFAGTIPTGFKKLCTADIPAPTITDPSKYFQVDTFTGTGSELVRTLTDGDGGAVKPDFVWIKDRDSAVEHVWTDSARGATKEISCEINGNESTVAQGLKSFDSSGYTLGTDASYNASSSLNVAWCWVASGGAGSSNTDGSINTTTTTVDTTAKFSVSTWVGTGANATVGHGLGVAPDFIINKSRDGGGDPQPWLVYHSANTAAPETDHLRLAGTHATEDAIIWNDTAPSATVFSVGASSNVNRSGESMVTYCWAGVEGYSKFGSYEGNGSTDGSFVWCGFRPAFVLVKNSSNAGENWYLWDAARTPANIGSASVLYPNTTAAAAEASARFPDFLSNGFKLRSTDTSVNATGRTYIFAAFAEFPFGGEDVSQARAR